MERGLLVCQSGSRRFLPQAVRALDRVSFWK
jgi:hypothetical protein